MSRETDSQTIVVRGYTKPNEKGEMAETAYSIDWGLGIQSTQQLAWHS